MARAAAVLCTSLLALPAIASAAEPTGSVYDAQGRLVRAVFAPGHRQPKLTEARVTRTFLRTAKVADWVARYPKSSLVTDASYDDHYRDWDVGVWSGDAGEIASGRVSDLTGLVTEAWTGPQVAWPMARGGGFGGKEINSKPVWLVLCAIFLVGLADLRRPLSIRNLDLLALLSFTASLWYFNEGRIFTSVPLAYPPLLYLLGRAIWIGIRGRPPTVARPLWPVWVLAAATVFLAGFRVGLDVHSPAVTDVGYSSVIGAERIAHGESPYGHMPVEEGRKACGPRDRDGRITDRIQTNGRCEGADAQGDTYGPVTYQSYLPGYWALGWKGKGDRLNAARFTTILFDLACIVGLALVGFRYGRMRLAVTLAFAWAAYPFTQYVASANTNDSIQPAFLIFGFWLAGSALGRGAFLAFSGWTKFASLLLFPLWATYPEASRKRLRPPLVFAAAFVGATFLAFWILLLEPDPLHAARVFWDRTLGWQIGRESPFSLWDWGQYHAGLPDLYVLQKVLIGLLVVGAIAVAFVPRRKSPLQLAALTAAVLIGFELVLTHWFYFYLPWFFPFIAFAVLAPAGEPVPAAAPATRRVWPAALRSPGRAAAR
jgi:hypothetical protein